MMHRRELLWRMVIPLGLILSPGVLNFLYIYRFGVNVPFWDEWTLVNALRAFEQGDEWLSVIWRPWISHRLFFPQVFLVLLAQLTDWNVIAAMYVSHVLAWLNLLTLWLTYRKTTSCYLWGFVPMAWLLFSLGQWENILWGWQIAVYLHIFAFLVAVYFLAIDHILLAILFGAISSYSFANGLLIWPIGFLLLFVLGRNRLHLIYWFIAGTLVVALYVDNFSFGNTPEPLAAGLAFIVVFFLANVSAPLAGIDLTSSAVVLSAVTSIALFLILLALGWVRWRDEGGLHFSEAGWILASLLLFSLSSSLLITVGRVGFGEITWAIGPRYVTITTIGISAIYLLLLRALQGERSRSSALPLFAVFALMLFSGLLAQNLNGYRIGEQKHESRARMKYALQNYRRQPEAALANLALPGTVEAHAPYLEERGLASFGDAMSHLFFTALDAGQPYPEIVPGQPVIQTFTCPVPHLENIGILFATFARENNADILVTLQQSETVLLRQELSTRRLADNRFRYFSLPVPFEDCQGEEVTLRIETMNGSSGNTVTVWTYPPYYDGRLQNPADPELADRVIGLELNTGDFEQTSQNWR
jgi:hypothetical protein